MFSAAALLLHLVLLGAIDDGIGDSGGEKPAPAATWLRVRTIPVEERPAQAVLPAGDPAPPVLPVTAARPKSSVTAALPNGASATIASARSPNEQTFNSNAAPAPTPLSSDPTSIDAFDSSASAEAGTLEAVPRVAADVPAEAPLEPSWVRVALDGARPAPAGFLAGERPPPTYRTVLPPPAILRYELRRGILRGTGEIRWRPTGDRYSLQFEARLAGFTLIAQSSQGELAANGLAPVRFVEQRARKAARSVNFSRDSATISFSASTARWPLLDGTQDRLSWMIQLGGIVAADPSLASTGRISMVLVSARGEASVRTARFVGREIAETATGSVPALKFVVDGHSAYDGSFEIWLDPARGYLPARAVSRASSGDAEFELLLQRADP